MKNMLNQLPGAKSEIDSLKRQLAEQLAALQNLSQFIWELDDDGNWMPPANTDNDSDQSND